MLYNVETSKCSLFTSPIIINKVNKRGSVVF